MTTNKIIELIVFIILFVMLIKQVTLSEPPSPSKGTPPGYITSTNINDFCFGAKIIIFPAYV